jgi:hypothetical protein
MPWVPSLVVAALLLILAAGLVQLHLRAWHKAQQAPSPERDMKFAWRQCRRRLQTSVMIGLVGVGILVAPLVDDDPMLLLLVWGAVLALLAWVVLLALADMLDTRQFFGRERRENLAEQVRLQHELRKRPEFNGSAAAKDEGEPGPAPG